MPNDPLDVAVLPFAAKTVQSRLPLKPHEGLGAANAIWWQRLT
jgi:hypothetical protein